MREEGHQKVVLVGRSDLDFIVEHACGRFQIEFIRDDRAAERAGEPESGVFMLYAETDISDPEVKHVGWALHSYKRS